MTIADEIIDRQTIRRKLGFWRFAALLALLVMVAVTFWRVGASGGAGAISRAHIAHVTISGAITGSDELLDRLERIHDSSAARALIVTIDSPGGTTAGGEALYEAVRRIAAEKPVIAQVDTLAASAGYMIASAADHIIARKTSIVGSIGVIFQYPKLDGLLDTLGIDMRAIKSTPMKAEPTFYGDTPPEAEAMIERLILDSYQWFKDIVAERRGFDAATIDSLSDGSVFTGRQALENGLIDSLGGRKAAEAWLRSQQKLGDLPVHEWKERRQNDGLVPLLTMLYHLGLGNGGASVPKTLKDRVFLDGLLSVWHGSNAYGESQ